MCGKANATKCLYLQSNKLSWRNALEACNTQGGKLLDFSLPESQGASLTENLGTVVSDEYDGVWTSGRTTEKEWYWKPKKSKFQNLSYVLPCKPFKILNYF